MSAERAKLTVKQLRQVRKALRRQNDAKFGYDQFGMRVQPKRLASHSRKVRRHIAICDNCGPLRETMNPLKLAALHGGQSGHKTRLEFAPIGLKGR